MSYEENEGGASSRRRAPEREERWTGTLTGSSDLPIGRPTPGVELVNQKT
jgi:hypothetical protein